MQKDQEIPTGEQISKDLSKTPIEDCFDTPSQAEIPKTKQPAPVPNPKKFSLFIKIGFIILITVALGALTFLYMQNKRISEEAERIRNEPPKLSYPKSVQETGPTADWETYSNEDLGFSLKYPQDWEIHDRLDEESRALQILKTGPSNGVLDWSDGSILIISPTDSENIDLSKELVVPKEVVSQLNTSVFNSRGWHGYGWESNTDDPINYNETIIATKSSPEGNIFKISWSQNNVNNALSAEKYLYQILSTFEFIK